jgi:arylformamidase
MRVVDCTGPLAPGMWHYGDPFRPYRAEVIATVAQFGYRAMRLELTTHMGTHMDAPKHWWEERAGTDAIDLGPFVGPARTLTVAGADRPLTEITPAMLEAAGGDGLKAGEVAVVVTGWHRRWFEPDFASATPFLSRAATQWLIDRGVRLVATDTALCCDPREGETRVAPGVRIPDHMLLDSGVPYVNAIVPAEPLPPEGYWFLALPLRIADGDGSPVRAAAVLP